MAFIDIQIIIRIWQKPWYHIHIRIWEKIYVFVPVSELFENYPIQKVSIFVFLRIKRKLSQKMRRK